MGSQGAPERVLRRHPAGSFGKLRWAGAAWSEGTLAQSEQSDGNDALSDAAHWGIPLHLVRRATRGVWPENVAAVKAFTRIATQFRTPGAMGGNCGLDYAAVPKGLKLAGIKSTPALWAQIQCIEAGAIEAIMRKFQ